MTELCRIAENVFWTHQTIYTTVDARNIRETFILKSFSKININKYFLSLSNHIYDQDPINNHLIQIIKEIFKTYFNIRIHHFNQSSSQPKKRIRNNIIIRIILQNLYISDINNIEIYIPSYNNYKSMINVYKIFYK